MPLGCTAWAMAPDPTPRPPAAASNPDRPKFRRPGKRGRGVTEPCNRTDSCQFSFSWMFVAPFYQLTSIALRPVQTGKLKAPRGVSKHPTTHCWCTLGVVRFCFWRRFHYIDADPKSSVSYLLQCDSSVTCLQDPTMFSTQDYHCTGTLFERTPQRFGYPPFACRLQRLCNDYTKSSSL